MAQRPSAYQIADVQRIRGLIPAQVRASPQFRPIAQNIQQKRGLRQLEAYEQNCHRVCESSRDPNCVQSCLQRVTEQTRVG